MKETTTILTSPRSLLTSTATTATLTSGSSTWSQNNPSYRFFHDNHKYYILGEYYNTSYSDVNLSIIISSLNILGRPYYNEITKNGIFFDEKLDEFIQLRLKITERDSKLTQLGID